jgi:hypothetical protein
MKSARDRWFAMLAAERVRRAYGELLVDGCDPYEALDAELRAMAERLAATERPLLEDASIVQRLAVLTYLPHRLSAAEQETEAAALDAWFEDYRARRRESESSSR